MNRRSRAKSSSLFLLELILAILFFSIASAVCVQIFVKSHLLSADAQALNLAVSECTGAAEMVYASDGMFQAAALLEEAYPESALETEAGMTCPVGEDLAFNIYYDESMEVCAESSAVYQMTVILCQDGSMLSADISMTGSVSGEPIYSLEAVHHVQEVYYE